MKAFLLIHILVFSSAVTYGQKKNVLFLGNSYTYENNLPQMVADMATSTGDTVIYDMYAPGGATFYGHSLSTISTGKIMTGNWDYVVLQGQSLELWGNFPDIEVSVPGAVSLDSLINIYNPCGETMFYRTWGRKNGFGSTSYFTLDSIIHVNYVKLADSLNGVLSPVGEVWKYIIENFPAIELYQADESHPSVAGTYAAACCFYSALFRKDPSLSNFNSSVSATDATIIKAAAKIIVYDSLLKWHIGEYDSSFVNCPVSGWEEFDDPVTLLYPNPSHEYISMPVPDSKCIVQLFNAQGLLIKELDGAAALKIPIADLPSGLYFIKQKGAFQRYKFIKI